MEKTRYSNSASEFISLVVIVLFVTTFVAQGTAVPTGSMEPTILVGDRLLLDKFSIRAHKIETLEKVRIGRSIKRGDIIVFKPVANPEGEYLVKRVIGMPGDTVEIKDKQVYINESILNEPYVAFEDFMVYSDVNRAPPDLYRRDNFGPVNVPERSYFVMGDNRDRSLDSRYWGFVPQDYVIGRPLFVFWSYEDEPYYQRTGMENLTVYVRRAIHFFDKTRWWRTGRIIR